MTAMNRATRVLTLAVVGIAVLGAVSACGGAKPSAAAPAASPPATGGGTGNRQAPGTFGVIAAASPGTLEVQDPTTGQTTVTYTSTTAFTEQKTVTLAAITTGECVVATDATAGARPSTSPAAPSSSTAPGTPTAITATTVTISSAVGGSCAAGFGGAAGAGRRPSGVPTGTRTGGGRGAGGTGRLVTGKVTSVDGTTVHVQAVDRQTSQPVDDAVAVTSATRYVETLPATSSAAAVGMCAQVVGPADSTGAVAATRIAISAPVNGSCTAGFGGRGGFGRRPGSATASTGG